MSQSPSDERSDVIVSTLLEAFEPLMESDPQGFRTKFRKMARDPFAFYRGTACLFYADVGEGGRYADFDRDWVAPGRDPHLDPGRPARRELRHLPGRRWAARLRRQRLRRGLPRALHVGPGAVLRQPGTALLAEGAARRGDRGPRGALRARLRGPDRALPERPGRHRVGPDPRHCRGCRARRTAPGQVVDALRDARVDDRGRGLPAPLRGQLGGAPARGRRGSTR